MALAIVSLQQTLRCYEEKHQECCGSYRDILFGLKHQKESLERQLWDANARAEIAESRFEQLRLNFEEMDKLLRRINDEANTLVSVVDSIVISQS